MTHFLKLTYLLLILLLIMSCNNSENKKIESIENKSIAKEYLYSIDTTGVSVAWTAYKFSNKVGVSGTFDTITLNKKNGDGSVENILNKLNVSISATSINSENPIRDFKINTYFFKVFNTSAITGTILKAKDGEGIVDLNMNRVSKKVPFSYALKNDTIRLFTHLDLGYWKGEEALNVLNKECYELHKGADKVSKLWPDVDVVIKLPMTKELVRSSLKLDL